MCVNLWGQWSTSSCWREVIALKKSLHFSWLLQSCLSLLDIIRLLNHCIAASHFCCFNFRQPTENCWCPGRNPARNALDSPLIRTPCWSPNLLPGPSLVAVLPITISLSGTCTECCPGAPNDTLTLKSQGPLHTQGAEVLANTQGAEVLANIACTKKMELIIANWSFHTALQATSKDLNTCFCILSELGLKTGQSSERVCNVSEWGRNQVPANTITGLCTQDMSQSVWNRSPQKQRWQSTALQRDTAKSELPFETQATGTN